MTERENREKELRAMSPSQIMNLYQRLTNGHPGQSPSLANALLNQNWIPKILEIEFPDPKKDSQS